MKKINIFFLFSSILISKYSMGQKWNDECVGYYQMNLPSELEVAVYPINSLISPAKEPRSDYGILIQRTKKPEITFGTKSRESNLNRFQADFSEFYYEKFKVGISSKNPSVINLLEYKKNTISDYEFIAASGRQLEKRDSELFDEPLPSEMESNRVYGFLIKDYNNAFSTYELRGYTLNISSGHRLYKFWSKKDDYLDDKSQTAENQWHKKEPEVKSLLSRFSPRELYEVPTKQGFCIPYGFIANDSGHESHNMAVTYRLKDHPDVTILFQTLTSDPGPGNNRPKFDMTEKEYVTEFWNRIYGAKFRDIKLYGKGFSYPKIDGRKAVAAFAKFTRYDKSVDYGYVAYVKGKTPDEPAIMFFVMRKGTQATVNPPFDHEELEKMAEHIVASIKKR